MNEQVIPEWFDEWFQRVFDPKEFYTPKEISIILETGRHAVYSALTEGALEAFRVGSSWRVPRSCLRSWLLSGWNLS